MSTEIVARDISVTPDQIAVVQATVFPGSTKEELALYLHDCARQGVHPLDRLIHPSVRTNKGTRRYVAITSIDLMRSRADDTGQYAGNDDPVFSGAPKSDGFTATTVVWKIVNGQRCPFPATARWSEYKPPDDFMWQKMPHVMLGKVAEALALRKAFPRQLHGLYAREEMAQSDHHDVDPPKRIEAPKPERFSAAFIAFGAKIKNLLESDGTESTFDERLKLSTAAAADIGLKFEQLYSCNADQLDAVYAIAERFHNGEAVVTNGQPAGPITDGENPY